ncbi:MAG: GNAT family N-acetyltransferase [Propionibacteriaceae bacterium]|jgi:ribosomal protein S18 acetylase RimI-like enzyme|nr:GNAT family N-acetyltransferase [Propionibacteriaceae bacterium]
MVSPPAVSPLSWLQPPGRSAPPRVERAGPDDASALAALAAATFPLACPPETQPDEILYHITHQLNPIRVASWLTDPLVVVHVGRLGQILVGYSRLSFDPAETDPAIWPQLKRRPTCQLSKCYVQPDWQGSGLADQLLAESLAAGRQRGAKGIWLGANPANLRARAFYGRHGFHDIGWRHFEVGGHLFTDCLMERDLAEP